MAAFAFSSILTGELLFAFVPFTWFLHADLYLSSLTSTGLVFMSLGKFKLGALVGFFPRSILIGAIGGVGVFLIETGYAFRFPFVKIPRWLC